MSTLAIVLIIILLIFVIASVIIVAVNIISSKKRKPSEIHFSGGADIDNGRVSSDNNYFKGLSASLGDTFVVNKNRKQFLDSCLYIIVKNQSDGKTQRILINDRLDFGRVSEKGVYVVNDKSVSRHHCRLIVQNRKVFLSDLNSSNHTYLNGRQVNQNVEINNGDVIKIGNTKLYIYYNKQGK